jgi:hypothetical protein
MNQIVVCQLDGQGYFAGLTVADESPLEPGHFHIPGGCVRAEPPEVPEGKRARWNGDSWTLEDPPQRPPRSPEEMWEAIKAERDRRTQAGGYQVGGFWYHSDTFSRTQQMGLVMLGASMPAGVMWKTMSGEMVEMTPTLAQQVFAAAAASDIAIFSVAEAHRAAMLASAEPSMYDFSGGWPAVFEG